MTPLSPAQLTQLRNRPHRTELFLGIYKPAVVASLQINQAGIAKGARSITVSVVSGTLANTVEGMTVYIGTTAGGKDIGRLRAISGSGTTLVLAENDINWVNGWYLTVTEFREPWAVFPRITLSAANVPSFFKDYNEVYTDEHSAWRPVVCMGGNVAGLRETGSLGVYFTGTGSFVPDGSIASYAWAFPSGTPSSASGETPGYIQYGAPGHYTATCTVTSALGDTFTGTRHVLVFDPPGVSTSNPIQAWGLTSFLGNREEGGYTAEIWMRETADESVLVDGALIVIWSSDWEGSVEGKVGGNDVNRDYILFTGYVEDGSIHESWFEDRYEFRAVSITGRMKALSTYSATLSSEQTASTWNEVVDLTVDKAVIAFLQDQSTILSVADYHPTNDVRKVQYADFTRGNLYQTLSEFLGGTIFAEMVSDRQGDIYTEVQLNMMPTGSRTTPVLLDMTTQDWRDNLRILEQQTPRLAYIEMGGVHYSGAETGTFAALLASAPGDPAGYFGGVRRMTGLVLSGQDQLNQLTALGLANENAEYPQIDIALAGDYRILDIAPQARVSVTLPPSGTYRGLDWNRKMYVPQEINYQYVPESKLLLMDMVSKEETSGVGGVIEGRTITIPIDPPYDQPDPPNWEYPDFNMPPIPSFNFPPIPPFGFPMPDIPEPTPPPQAEAAVAIVYDENIYLTFNYFDTSPTWHTVNKGTGTFGVISELRLNPGNPNEALVVAAVSSTDKEIWKTSNFLSVSGTSWTMTMDKTDFNDRVAIGTFERIFDLQYINGTTVLCLFRVGGGGPAAMYVARSEDGGSTWEDPATVMGGGYFPVTFYPSFIAPCKFGGTRVFCAVNGPGGTPGTGDSRVYYSDDLGLTWTNAEQWASAGVYGMLPLDFRDPGGNQALGIFRFQADAGNSLLYTPDAFTTSIDTSWYFGGFLWAGIAGLGNHDPDLTTTLQYCPADGNIYGLLMQTSTSNAETFFVKSPDNGYTWYILKLFTFKVAGNKICLGNADRHYALRLDVTTRWYPIGSLDGGLTWSDSLGNLLTLATANGDGLNAAKTSHIIYL